MNLLMEEFLVNYWVNKRNNSKSYCSMQNVLSWFKALKSHALSMRLTQTNSILHSHANASMSLNEHQRLKMTKLKKSVLGWFTYLYDPANTINPQGTESSRKKTGSRFKQYECKFQASSKTIRWGPVEKRVEKCNELTFITTCLI